MRNLKNETTTSWTLEVPLAGCMRHIARNIPDVQSCAAGTAPELDTPVSDVDPVILVFADSGIGVNPVAWTAWATGCAGEGTGRKTRMASPRTWFLFRFWIISDRRVSFSKLETAKRYHNCKVRYDCISLLDNVLSVCAYRPCFTKTWHLQITLTRIVKQITQIIRCRNDIVRSQVYWITAWSNPDWCYSLSHKATT